MLEATDLFDELLEVRDRDVLDVGCGEGWLVRRVAAAGGRPVGLDPLAPALERARSDAPDELQASFVAGVAEALPFADRSFDVVVFFNSLHHVPAGSMDAALDEAARVLRRDGLLFSQEPLAEGEFFELLRPVEDETRVRDAAQAALDRASGRSFIELAARDALINTRLADYDALRRRMISVAPARAHALDAHDRSLRATFATLGRPVAGGREFEQPVRVRLLAPVADGPARTR